MGNPASSVNRLITTRRARSDRAAYRITLVAGLLLLAACATRPSQDGPVPQRPQAAGGIDRSPGGGDRAVRALSRLPLYFEANQGQVDPRVAFTVRGGHKMIYFTDRGVTFALEAAEPIGDPDRRNRRGDTEGRGDGLPREPLARGRPPGLAAIEPPAPRLPGPPRRWVVRMDFVGSRRVRPEGLERTPAIVSYFKGRPSEWHAGVPTHARIAYRDLWPGIDLVYHGMPNQLKYTFHVRPGADPGQIRLAYRGADLALGGDGGLRVVTAAGSLDDAPPVSYQTLDGRQVQVATAFEIVGSGAGDREGRSTEGGSGPGAGDETRADTGDGTIVGFRLGVYDTRRPLEIDPAMILYGGYIGGGAYDSGAGVVVDGSGNAYVTGATSSTESTFPETVGPDLSYNGDLQDAFVAKVNSAGTALIYAGYIGGNDSDTGNSIAIDGSGNAYIGGSSFSTQATFPVAVGPDLTHNGGGDAFVAKVNAAGTALDFAGYIGGSGAETAIVIDLDGANNAYVTGFTSSNQTTFPETVGPDLTHNGANDAFVAKVNAAGTALVYAGYIGGSNFDLGYAIAVDGSGNAYVTGETRSSEATFPELVGPDLTYNGLDDVFVAKVNAAGTALVYAGYIGGSEDDNGYCIAVDGSANAYITGSTESDEATFPVGVGPDLTFNGGSLDGFVAKVNATGSALDYVGYIGGAGDDEGLGNTVDSVGIAYVIGDTDSGQATFPVNGGPDLTHNGGFDAFLASVDAAGTSLLSAGYIGGAGDDYGYLVALDSAGGMYVTGATDSTEASFPVAFGPDLTQNGGFDGFVAKVGVPTPTPTKTPTPTVTPTPTATPTPTMTPTPAPGDCNQDAGVDAGDLSALLLEIFDGDGSSAGGAPGGTYAGSSLGCDPNMDGSIDAADISCAVLIIFGGPGACP